MTTDTRIADSEMICFPYCKGGAVSSICEGLVRDISQDGISILVWINIQIFHLIQQCRVTHV